MANLKSKQQKARRAKKMVGGPFCCSICLAQKGYSCSYKFDIKEDFKKHKDTYHKEAMMITHAEAVKLVARGMIRA